MIRMTVLVVAAVALWVWALQVADVAHGDHGGSHDCGDGEVPCLIPPISIVRGEPVSTG